MAVDLSIGTVTKIFIFLCNIITSVFFVLGNYLRRPALEVNVSYVSIEFEGGGKKYCPTFTSVVIKNIGKSDLVFDLGNITIGNSPASYIIQQNTYFCRTLSGTRSDLALISNDEIMAIFKKHWMSAKLYTLKPHHSFSIPLFPQKMNSSMYFDVSNKAKFYFKKKKVQVTLQINSVLYDYSINRMKMLKLIMDDLISNLSLSHERLL